VTSRRRSRLALAAGTALGLTMLLAPPAAAEQAREHDLKAAFLYRFMQFIVWPDDAFAAPHDSFVVGILGPDPFGETLDGILAGERVGQRPIVLERYGSPGEIETCHLLFVNDRESHDLAGTLDRLGRHGLVTVGDVDQFAENGGAIGFVGDADRISLVINTERGRAAGVVFSSKLLHLARTVDGLP